MQALTFSFSAGSTMRFTPAACAAKSFSLMPPTGNTAPRKEICQRTPRTRMRHPGSPVRSKKIICTHLSCHGSVASSGTATQERGDGCYNGNPSAGSVLHRSSIHVSMKRIFYTCTDASQIYLDNKPWELLQTGSVREGRYC